ncbi:hypothetical protein DESC_690024 [Desulfosarcina cetonica]|nr:hypothetical protein DESC_690024 [Desulfosarcina cetonica]
MRIPRNEAYLAYSAVTRDTRNADIGLFTNPSFLAVLEGGQGGLAFLGGDTGQAGLHFEVHQRLQADLAPGHVESLFDHLQGKSGVGGDLGGHGHHRGHESVQGHGLVHQADAHGFAAVDIFPGEEQFTGLARSDQILDQPEGAAGDRRGDLGFGAADLGLLGGDADVAGQGQFVARTDGVAVDGGDGRFFEADHATRNVLQGDQVVPVGFQGAGFGFLEVGAGGKGPALAGDHHHLDGFIRAGIVQGGLKIQPEAFVHGIEHLGAIESGDGHAVGFVVNDAFKIHGFSCLGRI